jgi:glycosyltransferase involved in cell wall biosynthesis
MKILINALSVTTGGGLTSFLHLVPAFANVDARNEYHVLLSRYQTKLLAAIPEKVRMHVVNFNPKETFVRLLYEQFVLPWLVLRWNIDWLYSPGNSTSVFAPCHVLLVVENANPYSTQRFDWPWKERFRKTILYHLGRCSAWRATKIRFLSHNSKELISAKLKIPERKAVVIPHGVSVNNNQVSQRVLPQRLPARYILTVTNIGPHKNLHTLFEAFDILVTRYGYPGSLVIVGEATYGTYYQTLLEHKQRLRSGDRMIFLGWIDPEQLPAVYHQAELFVFPSVEETFGLPVVEAMAEGVPVLVPEARENDRQLFIPYREFCGDAVAYFEPFSAEQLYEQMRRILEDQSLRERLSAEGKRVAHRYRWDDVAAALVDVFEGAQQ